MAPKQIQAAFRPEEDLLARAIAQGPKTVDVPASLPTPPHNNQEELRWVPLCPGSEVFCGPNGTAFCVPS